MEKIARNVGTVLTVIGTDMKTVNGSGSIRMEAAATAGAAAATVSTEINGDRERVGKMAMMTMNNMIPIQINGTSTEEVPGSNRVGNIWVGATEKIMSLVATTTTMANGTFTEVVDGNAIAIITNRYRRS